MDPARTDTTAGKAALTGRVALLLAAFACAVAASFAAGTASFMLLVAAVAMAGAAGARPFAIRLGRALKPASDETTRGAP